MNTRDVAIILDYRLTRIRQDAEHVASIATDATVDKTNLRRAYSALFDAADALARIERML